MEDTDGMSNEIQVTESKVILIGVIKTLVQNSMFPDLSERRAVDSHGFAHIGTGVR